MTVAMIGVSGLSNLLRGMKVRPTIWIASDPLSRTARCENPRQARRSLRIPRLEDGTFAYFTLNFETWTRNNRFEP